MPFDPTRPAKVRADADVVVDTRQKLKTPVEPEIDHFVGVSKKTQCEFATAWAALSPFFHERPTTFRSQAIEQRNTACHLVSWKLSVCVSGKWGASQADYYAAALAKNQEYWHKFVTPDETANAEWIAARLKALFLAPLKDGATWSGDILLHTVRELGL